jgi:hypothetical protein
MIIEVLSLNVGEKLANIRCTSAAVLTIFMPLSPFMIITNKEKYPDPPENDP